MEEIKQKKYRKISIKKKYLYKNCIDIDDSDYACKRDFEKLSHCVGLGH